MLTTVLAASILATCAVAQSGSSGATAASRNAAAFAQLDGSRRSTIIDETATGEYLTGRYCSVPLDN